MITDLSLLDSFHGSHLTENEHQVLTIACKVWSLPASTHTPLLIPFPHPHWPQMFQSSSHPRTFARAVSFAYKALQTLSLPPPGIYLNPFGSARLPATLFKIVSPDSLSPVCLVIMSSTLYFIAYLFWCWFSTTNRSSPVGRSFVCFVLSCVLGTQNNARHPMGTQQIRVGWMSK